MNIEGAIPAYKGCTCSIIGARDTVKPTQHLQTVAVFLMHLLNALMVINTIIIIY